MIAGAGACDCDVAIFNDFESDTNGGLMEPPFILGHENFGWVEKIGPGVTGFAKGDVYLCYGPVGCDRHRHEAGGHGRGREVRRLHRPGR